MWARVVVSTRTIDMAVPVLSVSSTTTAFLNTYYGQDRPLRPYFFSSCLFSVLFLFGLFICKNIFCTDQKEQTKQVIDIELMSNADYQDKKDFLPSNMPPVFVIRSAPKPVESTKQIEEKTSQAQSKPQNSWHEIIVDNHLPSDLPKLAQRYLPMSAPLPVMPLKLPVRRHPSKSDAEIDIEEVQPPELVEVKENDGDTTNELWQDGGHSALGTGAYSSLASYLKDLHRKLRQHWSPPQGSVRHIKVVFRLAKDGSVISIKLMRSSGNILADNSALAAIRQAAPFGKLPADYSPQYLDLAYTFNYTSDELTEIPASSQD